MNTFVSVQLNTPLYSKCHIASFWTPYGGLAFSGLQPDKVGSRQQRQFHPGCLKCNQLHIASHRRRHWVSGGLEPCVRLTDPQASLLLTAPHCVLLNCAGDG